LRVGRRARDVGDRSDVVPVDAMPEPEDEGGAQEADAADLHALSKFHDMTSGHGFRPSGSPGRSRLAQRAESCNTAQLSGASARRGWRRGILTPAALDARSGLVNSSVEGWPVLRGTALAARRLQVTSHALMGAVGLAAIVVGHRPPPALIV